jgi:hypothetical protein
VKPLHTLPMRASCGNQPTTRTIWRLGAAFLFMTLFGGSLIVSADTPAALRHASVGTCYCHCAAGRAHRACVKMCDSARYARKSAVRCVKPHFVLPIETRDEGPRYQHPGRPERAAITPDPASTQQPN